MRSVEEWRCWRDAGHRRQQLLVPILQGVADGSRDSALHLGNDGETAQENRLELEQDRSGLALSFVPGLDSVPPHVTEKPTNRGLVVGE